MLSKCIVRSICIFEVAFMPSENRKNLDEYNYFSNFISSIFINGKLAIGARIHQLEKENRELRADHAYLTKKQRVRCKSTQTNIHVENFSVESVSNSKIKNLFQYYTITYLRISSESLGM